MADRLAANRAQIANFPQSVPVKRVGKSINIGPILTHGEYDDVKQAR